MKLDEKFKVLDAGNAPGQEVRQDIGDLNTVMRGEKFDGVPVDFSHGDVDAFPPTPGSDVAWNDGFSKGASQAYTEYRGAAEIRIELADRLSIFTGSVIDANSELIITPGTQGALFLAIGATVTNGTKVAVVEPDYFANRKLVKFFGGEVVPIPLNYEGSSSENGPDLNRIEAAFKNETEVFVFSTPNNPTGVVYSASTITKISELAATHNVTVIVDELYSRMLYSGENYTHLRSCSTQPKNIITIMGPSKTESLSGFRLGVGFGTSKLIERMERLQAIVSLRAPGYNQAALNTWFQEPLGWMENRIQKHEAIRDELLTIFRSANLHTASPQAGSYLFPQLPPLNVDLSTFVRLLRLQANVIVTPGSEFDPACNDRIRLNFSQDHVSAIAAVKRIVKMIEIYSI
ncbi:pyridoxal phosphate-dependent aminotransferase [Xanthomarina gelatinilytica]|uniref:pyridoxal phosphate-dependent aminotransferase n=1 Tax=Xanthomarina gelatinilytica TaxID=1137281 RepID=UPI003AA9E002